MKLLDTCFLMDLQREWVKAQPGRAMQYLESHPQEEFAISVITGLEFLEGYEEQPEGERFLAPFRQIDFAGQASRMAARLRRDLRRRGKLMGDFDILIAVTALHESLALVTNNTRHFNGVPALRIESY